MFRTAVRPRRAWVVAVTAALAATGIAVPVLRHANGPADDAARFAGVVEQSDEASATLVAVKTGRRIEVADKRSPSTQVFANPDGSYTAEQTVEPVRAQRADGTWGAIDPTLQAQADGTYRTVATATAVTISGGGTVPVIAMRDGSGHELSMTWPGPLPAPAVSGDVATYAEVLPGVDLQVRADKAGARKVLVVKTPEAARNPKLRELSFTLHTTGLKVSEGDGETLIAKDDAGHEIFIAPTPSLWDATPGRSDGGAPLAVDWAPSGNGRVATVDVRVDGDRIMLRPDPKLLDDPGAVYPIRIDPVWGYANQNYWQLVGTQNTGKSYVNGGDRPNDAGGKVSVGTTRDNGSTYTWRAFMHFSAGFFHGKQVLEAYYLSVLSHSWSFACTQPSYQLEIHRVNGMRGDLTWDNHHNIWAGGITSRSETHGNPSGSCPGDLTISTNVTGLAQQAANERWDSLQFGLKSANESCDPEHCMGWRRFKEGGTAPDGGSVMRLSVRYNTIPDAASAIQVDGRPCDNTTITVGAGASYAVSALIKDGDGDNSAGILHVYNSDNSLMQALNSGWIGNNVRANWQVQSSWFTSGRTYPMRVQTWDGNAESWSATCSLAVDTIRPADPDVDSVDYPEGGTPRGSVGKTGAFLLKVPADAVKVRYGTSDPPVTELPVVSGANPTVMITPAAQGANFVHVQVQDAAGNLSNVYHYQYTVGAPADPVAHWKLDEGTGTTTADTAYPQNPDDGNWPSTVGGAGMQWRTDPADAKLGHGTYLRVSPDAINSTATGPVLDTTRSYTVATWVRLNAPMTGGNRGMLTQAGTRVGAFSLMYNGGSNRWAFQIQQTDSENGSRVWVDGPNPPQVGVWTHLAGVYDAGSKTAMLYINGTKVGQQPVGAVWNATGPFRIGRMMWQGAWMSHFIGDIDDVRVYNRVVSPSEFAGFTKRVEGWWGFQDGSTTAMTDRSGNGRNGTLAAGAGIVPGFDGHGVTFNGLYGNAQTSAAAVRTDGGFTVSAWVRLIRSDQWQTAVSQDGNRVSGFYLHYQGDAKKWAFSLPGQDVDAPASTARAMSNRPARIGEWTHIAGVYDPYGGPGGSTGKIQIYVNGAAEGSQTVPAHWNATGPLAVGRFKAGGQPSGWWYGDIDEVMVHTGVLNAQEIAVLADNARRIPPAQQYSGDFTGDGKADSVVVSGYPDKAMKLWQLTTSSGEQLEQPVKVWDSTEAWEVPVRLWHDTARWIPGDFNGDGKADIAVLTRNDTDTGAAWVRSTEAWVFYSNGAGFDPPQQLWVSPADDTWALDYLDADAGDVTGDGLDDLVVMREDGIAEYHIFVLAGTAAGDLADPVAWHHNAAGAANGDPRRITLRVGDADADGKADVVQMYHYDGNQTKLWVNYSDGTRFTGATQVWDSGAGGFNAANAKLVVGDVTGDGRADVTAYYDTGASRQLRTWTSAGRSTWAAPAVRIDTATCGTCGTALNAWANLTLTGGDITGDGTADLTGLQLQPDSKVITIWSITSTGMTFNPPAIRYVSGADGL